MIEIKQLNGVTVKAEDNTLTVDFREFVVARGRDYRTVIDLNLKWAREFIGEQFKMSAEQWATKPTKTQVVKLLLEADKDADRVLYAMSWAPRKQVK